MDADPLRKFRKLLTRYGYWDYDALCKRFEQMKPLWDTITVLEAKDPNTRHHSSEVSTRSARMALQMGLSEAEIKDIKLAGIFHDIGKVHVPEYVLNKPAPLNVKEFELMKTHAVLGAKILEPLTVPAIERIVRYHHERIDGAGYPKGLAGHAIPLGARIVAVANAFDAMISHQPYRKARSLEEAVAEIRCCSGTQFDPEVVDALVYLVEFRGAPPWPDMLAY